MSATCATGTAAEVDGVSFGDLQGALDAAVPYDTIVVCPGTHVGGFTVRQSVRLVGATGDAADVVLTGDGVHRVLEVLSTVFQVGDLTVRDGNVSSTAAGLDMGDASGTPFRLFVRNVRFESNQGRSGGALRFTGRRLVVKDSQFSNNVGDGDGGAVNVHAIGQVDQDILFEDVVFTENIALNRGGAMTLNLLDVFVTRQTERNITLRRVQMVDNRADWGGGGAVIEGDIVDVLIEDSRVVGNEAYNDLGGGIWFTSRRGDFDVQIVDTLAADNFAGDWGSAYAFDRLSSSSFAVHPIRARLRGGGVLANRCPVGSEDYGAVVRMGVSVLLDVVDVDLGTGPTNNGCWDLAQCDVDLGASTSFRLDHDDPSDCP